MGHGIAQVSATAGYNVVLRDIKQEFLDKAMEKIKWSLDKLVTKEKISNEELDGSNNIKALENFNQVINRFPNSKYARDSQQKIILVKSNIAANIISRIAVFHSSFIE